MRALVQRVAEASVTVDGTQVGRTGEGLVVLLGVSKDDGEADARYLVDKVATLRVFADESGRFNRSALDTGAELLVIPQFTLYADTRRGRRPDFTQAAAPEEAEGLYQRGRGDVPGAGPEGGDGTLPGAHAGGDQERRPRHYLDRQRRPVPPAAGLDVPPHSLEEAPKIGDLSPVGYVVPHHLG